MSSTEKIDSFEEHLGRKHVERSVEAYRRVLGEYQSFIEARGKGVETATSADCDEWVRLLRDRYADSTVATYAGYVHHFYEWLHATGEVGANPMYETWDSLPESVDKGPKRRDISIAEMRAFVKDINHPLHRAMIIALLKTGLRVGELCNLDIEDVQQDEGLLRIASRIDAGEQVRGEERTAANKRASETLIPIDDELERAFRGWLCIRPDPISPANPLFMNTADGWGRRITPPAVRSTVEKYTEAAGWYRAGAGASENVTPHYFRHFFTTWMRERIGETGSVAYLRGDVIGDADQPYVHNWQNRAQTAYREHIYSIAGGGR